MQNNNSGHIWKANLVTYFDFFSNNDNEYIGVGIEWMDEISQLAFISMTACMCYNMRMMQIEGMPDEVKDAIDVIENWAKSVQEDEAKNNTPNFLYVDDFFIGNNPEHISDED